MTVGAAEGRFGIDHPAGFTERSEPCDEGARVRQPSQIVEEGQLPGALKAHQPFQKQASEQMRPRPHVKKEPRLASDPSCAIGRQAAARDDHVDLGVVSQR